LAASSFAPRRSLCASNEKNERTLKRRRNQNVSFVHGVRIMTSLVTAVGGDTPSASGVAHRCIG
jgi:hypothetical protein